jgi:hypothetical protein
MNPADIAPMVVAVTLIVVGGGVALLRPISKRLGAYLEAATRARREGPPALEPRVMETLERIDERLRLVEERQDFTDALLNRPSRRERIAAPARTSDDAAGRHAQADVLD